ncbi:MULTISPECIES: ADP-ribosylglycohydrolase family protein [Microbacterium]|uniref:Crystallin J1 n=1 Tax=Microbacterium wangchenii TaxID=2541726 RepID=A0ABX5SZZ7_9MICO|nr:MULTISPECIES: ADP-ribosylglycohydrolase family protein [Microbacterium]MCK6066114.1 ADP-ribosylglycohydrolase family protein [Microbacterium sp. EYE_512]QBR90395.1 crystallin J1 [Microbacterium wangchenii]TFV84798.1 crystallin J1 [Microbacterium sp. dk485]TXK11589.1 crystallin J1 [Microbacterium wangchenii]
MDTDRARGALLGLAIGDAMGAPTEGMTLPAIRERWGRVTDFVEEDAAGTDDTEYAVLCARGVLAAGDALTSDVVARTWQEALRRQRGGFHGAGFSEMIAIANLQAGLRPPASGRRNAEMWSDGAAMRVAPIGVYAAGDVNLARRMAVADARVSHSRDGVFCAEAVAAGVAVAMVSETFEPVLDAMLSALPADSWSLRLVRRALDLVEGCASPAEAEETLFEAIPLRHYMWADVAPEALALCVGLLRAVDGRLDVIESGVNIGRDSDTIAAMGGAVAGALHGAAALPPDRVARVRAVTGRCIEATAGTDLIDLADALVARAEADRERRA